MPLSSQVNTMGSFNTEQIFDIDYSDKDNRILTLPAGIDIHVHFREPGLEHKETMYSGQLAAQAGGIATVVDMPNTIPPTDTVNNYAHKLSLAKKYRGIIVATGFTNRSVDNEELYTLAYKSRILKVFMANSTGNLMIDKEHIIKGLKQISNINRKVMIMFHAEDPDYIQKRTKGCRELDVRPVIAEYEATKQVLEYAANYPQLQFHVTHVSSYKTAKLLSNQSLVSWDVLPKYLQFDTSLVDKIGNYARMNPPLRTKSDVIQLRELLFRGKIPIIASDHAPHTHTDKVKMTAGAPAVQETYPFLIDLYLRDKLKLKTMINVIYNNPKMLLESLDYRPTLMKIDVDTDNILYFNRDEIKSKCGWSLWENYEFRGHIIKMY